MYKIDKLKRTCMACPTQYEGKLDTGQMVYIRYRWGRLSIRISYGESDDVSDAVKGLEIFSASLGDALDGIIDYDEIVKVCKNVIEFPNKIDIDE